MAQIGQFTRTQAGYSGRIRTLSLDLAIVFVPTDNADVENAPDCRIRLGDEDGIEIGAGWLQTGDRAGAYISVILDDSCSRSAPACSSRTRMAATGACTGRARRSETIKTSHRTDLCTRSA